MLQQTEDDQTSNILAQYAVETGFVLFVYDLDWIRSVWEPWHV